MKRLSSRDVLHSEASVSDIRLSLRSARSTGQYLQEGARLADDYNVDYARVGTQGNGEMRADLTCARKMRGLRREDEARSA